MSSALVLSVTVLHPQKSRFQYTVDSLFLSAMTVIFYAANVTTFLSEILMGLFMI